MKRVLNSSYTNMYLHVCGACGTIGRMFIVLDILDNDYAETRHMPLNIFSIFMFYFKQHYL